MPSMNGSLRLPFSEKTHCPAAVIQVDTNACMCRVVLHSCAGDSFSVPFRQQVVSYLSGLLLLVVVPMVILKVRYGDDLSRYGIAVGDVSFGMRSLFWTLAIAAIFFYQGASRPEMWAEYPQVYQGLSQDDIRRHFTWSGFMQYELLYAFYFFTIEWVFRGLLLSTMRRIMRDSTAVLVCMLPYTVWHLPKPSVECLTTLIWGITAGATVIRSGSIWYTTAAHWSLNVFMDITILWYRGIV